METFASAFANIRIQLPNIGTAKSSLCAGIPNGQILLITLWNATKQENASTTEVTPSEDLMNSYCARERGSRSTERMKEKCVLLRTAKMMGFHPRPIISNPFIALLTSPYYRDFFFATTTKRPSVVW